MRCIAMLTLWCGVATWAGGTAQGAALRALAADGNTCWAAGDSGAVLRSDDGGATWRRVAAPTSANLQAIHLGLGQAFLFGGQGLAGHPHGAGLAAILRTGDGGRSFQHISPGPAGWLHGGSFAGATGVIYGQAGFAAPGGILRTIDGGRLWGPAAVSGGGFLLAGDFHSPRYGYAVGANHRIVSLRNLAEPRLRPPQIPSRLSLRAVRFADEALCWCVGDNGAIFRSRTAGQPWDPIPLTLPPGARRSADLEAVAFASTQRAWVAGGLIGVVPYTDNGGGSWRLLPAPQGGCLHALVRLPGGALLAAGDGERIWRSDDEGGTWKLVHGRAETDVLFVLAAADRSAYPAMVAHAAAGCSVAVVYATSLAAGGDTPPDQALRAAAAKAGADGIATLSEFPSVADDPAAADLTEAEILRRWSVPLDAPAEEEMSRQLAAAIRLYRPFVLAVGPAGADAADGAPPRGATAENRLVSRLAQHAARLASAEDGAGMGDLAQAGLAPWAVRRVFVGLPANERWAAPWEQPPRPDRQAARVSFDTARFPNDANLPLELLAAEAAWLLPGSDLLDRPGQASAYACPALAEPLRLFTSGLGAGRLVLTGGQGAQRDLATCASLRAAVAADQTYRAAGELIPALQQAGSPELAALAGDRLLLAWRRLLQEGRLIEADLVLAAFARKSRHHPLGQAMDVLALAASVSSEWKAQLTARGLPKKMELTTLERAAEGFGGWLAWCLTPEGRLLHAKALVGAGKLAEARQVLGLLAREPYPEPWRSCALLELGDPETLDEAVRGRRTATATLAADRGRFDGRLDEPCWQAAEMLLLSPPEGPGARPAVRAGDRPRRPELQVVRSAGGFAIFGLRLPRVVGRQWNVEIAVDADRDAWTQVVLQCDTEGRKSAGLLFRPHPRADLGPNAFQVRMDGTDAEWTVEVGVPLSQFFLQAPPVELWNFQVRATARDMTGDTPHYFQPQDDPRLLPERYGLLKVPALERAAPGRPQTKP